MLRKFSIGTRIVALMLFIALCIGLMIAGSIVVNNILKAGAVKETQMIMLQNEKERLKLATHSTAMAIGAALKDITDPERRIQAMRDAVDGIYYEKDKSGYYFIYEGTVVVALPPLKERQGRDLKDAKDANGVYFVRELEKNALSGGGFVEYVFPKPAPGGASKETPKLAYSEKIPGTNTWIGTGIYLDNIDAEKARIQNILDDVSRGGLWILLGIVFVMILLALPISIMLIRSIIRPLRHTADVADKIAQGDLEQKITVEGNDEITRLSQAFTQVVDTIKKRITEAEVKSQEALEQQKNVSLALAEANAAKERADANRTATLSAAANVESVAQQLLSVSTELSSQVDEASHSCQTQYELTRGAATAMDEMNVAVLEVAKKAGEASNSSEASREKAGGGANIVKRSIEALRLLQNDTVKLQSEMRGLGEQANSIGAIITVINDIADQTNLLALNAAIEAARAGDAGRGFAVVADEVRKLAEKTMEATKQVGNAISSIQQRTGHSVQAMDKAAANVQSATDFAAESGNALDGIVLGAATTADQIRSIATAAEEQSASSYEINSAIDKVRGISDETMQLMSQSSMAVGRLMEHTNYLQELVQNMRKQNA